MQQIWILVQLLIILLEKYFQRTKINSFPLRKSFLEKVVLKKKKKKKMGHKIRSTEAPLREGRHFSGGISQILK